MTNSEDVLDDLRNDGWDLAGFDQLFAYFKRPKRMYVDMVDGVLTEVDRESVR